jgi:hypothetical protein
MVECDVAQPLLILGVTNSIMAHENVYNYLKIVTTIHPPRQ